MYSYILICIADQLNGLLKPLFEKIIPLRRSFIIENYVTIIIQKKHSKTTSSAHFGPTCNFANSALLKAMGIRSIMTHIETMAVGAFVRYVTLKSTYPY